MGSGRVFLEVLGLGLNGQPPGGVRNLVYQLVHRQTPAMGGLHGPGLTGLVVNDVADVTRVTLPVWSCPASRSPWGTWTR